MHCYCANYYGAVNCHNKVPQFGERCRLCTVMNEGRSAREEILNAPQVPLYDSNSSRDDSSREERRGRGRDRKTKGTRHVRQYSD
ncbi:hypothetical protein JX265_013286 [Neoarthrinium moseri]|uniref:Uncharacterized protein n=1 Tax=Neoarthrinium moseri TaxID=1658444 RepID=A0A9P9W8Z0_9PEZI|nr:uncharacterized protein JN550_003233 [Neoarthrinium moseri]KAI1851168.1 hypothetical protein JX265_013286 [Neoarthrinium moseri]KAI1851845.1 hypothetical protein JX266_002698 [Neoarthrinium moseri]KAI1873964.1 hypothetical protein JN550_003233 [Neoarthrinium moseri]